MKTLPNEKEHPFPNKEMNLLIRLHKDSLLSKEDYQIVADLFHKYLNLRAEVFHDY